MSTSRYSRDMEIYEYSGSNEHGSTNYDDDTKISSAVEPLESNLENSFKKFKGKQLSSRRADFSDSVSRPATFRTDPNDFELSEDKRDETLIQRYHRLKQEVTQLVSDVEEIKDSKSMGGSVSPGDIVLDLQELQKQLHQLELDKALTNSTLVGGDPANHALLFKELQAELAAVKSLPTTTDKTVYEVYANLESAKFGHLSKLSEIEGRLTVLEGLVGPSDTKGSLVAAGLDTEYKDLSAAVLGLQAKLAVLDKGHIESVTKQLTILLDNIKELQTQSKQLENDPDQQHKINDALEKVAQVTPLLTLVPDLVDRLHTLKDLHGHTATLVNTVAGLSEGQSSLHNQVETCTSLLEQVQKSVGANLDGLQNNFTQLQSRIDKLQK